MDRQAQASLTSRMGYRIVEVLNTATVAGLLMAVAAFFWANRLLPLALPPSTTMTLHAAEAQLQKI